MQGIDESGGLGVARCCRHPSHRDDLVDDAVTQGLDGILLLGTEFQALPHPIDFAAANALDAFLE